MKRHHFHIATALMVLLIGAPRLTAQRIGFGISFGAGVTVDFTADSPTTLDFNEWARPRFIVVGDTRSPVVRIGPGENEGGIVRLRITAPADADVTITVTAPPENRLELNGNSNDGSLPVNIGWGYWNPADAENADAPTQLATLAREVVRGDGTGPSYTSVTFPMKRRVGAGPPTTPPDPGYVGRTPAVTMAVAYLTVYGSIPTVPVNTVAGVYTGTINVNVELSTYAAGGNQ